MLHHVDSGVRPIKRRFGYFSSERCTNVGDMGYEGSTSDRPERQIFARWLREWMGPNMAETGSHRGPCKRIFSVLQNVVNEIRTPKLGVYTKITTTGQVAHAVTGS